MTRKPRAQTNKIGSGTTNLTVNTPNELHQAIHRLAKESVMKLGECVRILLWRAVTNETKFKTIMEENRSAADSGVRRRA